MDVKQMNRKMARFYRAMQKDGVPQSQVEAIMAGADDVDKKDQEAMRDWFVGAMRRMEGLMPMERRRGIREACACCLTGKRDAITKGIREAYGTVDQRLDALSKEQYVVGHSAQRLSNGDIRVRFSQSGEGFRCPCLPAEGEPLPASYCMCCGGHIRFHLENALGVKAVCTVVSSAQMSQGKDACVFDYRIVG